MTTQCFRRRVGCHNSENEDVYEDHANNDSDDDVDWKRETYPHLEDIIEYYKQTEDQLHEVSLPGNHLLIEVEEQNDVNHVDEVDQLNEMTSGSEVEEQIKQSDEVEHTKNGINGNDRSKHMAEGRQQPFIFKSFEELLLLLAEDSDRILWLKTRRGLSRKKKKTLVSLILNMESSGTDDGDKTGDECDICPKLEPVVM
ncbi:hypothetical protein QVD17_38137 [Tagetes erecta]|uniref:Uncharacterized protein n=1 Tax=Tagetes erecta TaxID=13708 RepID=A0AAD8JXK5_TARER|nr:hypothetical protein QVD17_38137 [Tagetes erecta]